MGEKIFAGIVTYNPEISRLKENISAVVTQVDGLIVVDNGSVNLEEVELLTESFSGAIFISNLENKGVAAALNSIFRKADECGGVYVLTLDQDSVVYSDIIDSFRDLLEIEGAASFASLREERGFNPKQTIGSDKYIEIDKCITSGNLVKIDAWKSIGGFNEKLFIDMVDTEFCYRLRRQGYNIIRLNKVEITHELGAAFEVNFLGKKRTVLNHSAFRRYYIFRNTMYLLREYPEARKSYSYKELFVTFCAALLFEKDKWHKVCASVRGVVDSFKF